MDLTSRSLRALFTTLAAPSALAAAGCDDVDPPFPGSAFETDVCSDETGTVDWLGDLTLAVPADGLIERTLVDHGLPDSDPTFTDRSIGVPCATATDVDACLASVAALPVADGLDRSAWELTTWKQLIATRGDAIEQVTTPEGLLALLGAIDTANEAMLVTLAGTDYYASCGRPNARERGGGFEVVVGSGSACGSGDDRYQHLVRVGPDGTVTTVATRLVERGNPNCAIGRRTGEMHVATNACGGIGEVLARMAALEAASVVSFLRLADEMVALGAPADLVARARRSAEDEARHVALVETRRRRFDGATTTVAITAKEPRTPFAIALENAREGMVRETYGALEATYRANHATDPDLARMFRTIAIDETRHAALALDFGRWLEATLSSDEQALVTRARRDEAESLAAIVTDTGEDEFTDAQLGTPSPARARALIAGAFPTVWS